MSYLSGIGRCRLPSPRPAQRDAASFARPRAGGTACPTPGSCTQKVKRKPNSPHSERGIVVALGLMNPAGWSNVDALAMLPL